MAKVVLGFGSSHGPTIRSQPADWQKLADRDKKDPRYDYAELLRNADPKLEQEITLEKKQQRYDLAQAAIAKLAGVVQEAAPDVVIVISNQHSVLPDDQLPVMSVYRGESLTDKTSDGPKVVDERTERMSGPAHESLFRKRHEPRVYPGFPQLADHLIDSLIDEGFDVATWNALRPEHGVDEAFTTFYDFYDTTIATPMVPLMLNRYLPSQVKPARAYALGGALRRAIDSWDSDKRVALMASGGLSHQVLDEELDHIVIDALLENDAKALGALDRPRLNRGPGTPETLNWITVAGAMNAGMTLIDYVPAYRSPAGTGHGLTFGYWNGGA
jgi:3-O-methylgallate 3,4-dioxygenase